MPAQFDRGKTERELRTCWTLVSIDGPIIREVILAEEPELLVGRGDRPGYVGGDAGFQAGLDLLAVVVAPIRHGIERAAQDFFGLQRHRTEPIPVTRVVGHIVGDNELVLTVHRRLHVGADLRAVSLPELHGTALRIRQGELRRAARFSLCLQIGIAKLAVLERLVSLITPGEMGVGIAYDLARVLLRKDAQHTGPGCATPWEIGRLQASGIAPKRDRVKGQGEGVGVWKQHRRHGADPARE